MTPGLFANAPTYVRPASPGKALKFNAAGFILPDRLQDLNAQIKLESDTVTILRRDKPRYPHKSAEQFSSLATIMKSITRVQAYIGLFLLATILICNAAAPDLSAPGIAAGSAYENKTRGIHIRVPAGWDFEDLGATAVGRWDFLIKPPARKSSGAIHIIEYTGAVDAKQVSAKAIAEITQGHAVIETVEEPATPGKWPGRVVKVVYGGSDSQCYNKIYLCEQGGACWVFHCYLETLDASLAVEMDAIIQGIRLSAKRE